jgi:membrane-bound metal-dependent hydrolase YbcI (DUF457 family)
MIAGFFYLINNVTLTDFQILTIFGIIAGGIWGHVLVDQLGWLGSNLLWPITGKRKTGMGLTRSMDPLGNFLTTYILTVLILWNLNRFAPEPVFPWNNIQFFLFLIIVPIALILAGLYIYHKRHPQEEKTRDEEELEEVAMEIAQM